MFVDDRLRNDEGDLLGRPRLDRYAARELARTPPSEGLAMTDLPRRIDASAARQRRRGIRRFGEEPVCVDFDQHRLAGISRGGG